jgi:peptidylprolyl isomerase
MTRFLAALALLLGLALPAAAQSNASQAPDPQNTIVLTTKTGPVVIKLRPDLAPKHVERIKTLAKEGFYDGIVFHRVIEGFMAQTGDPTGTGMGGSKLPNLPAEFSQAPFKRGTLGMARASSPNSANSQFFICFADAPNLNGQYTVFGEVISGMENVDKIKKGDPAANGVVTAPDKIVSMRLLADAK